MSGGCQAGFADIYDLNSRKHFPRHLWVYRIFARLWSTSTPFLAERCPLDLFGFTIFFFVVRSQRFAQYLAGLSGKTANAALQVCEKE